MANLLPIADLRKLNASKRVPYLKEALLLAIQQTVDRDPALFAIGVHEQTICHRVAVHLELLWGQMNEMSIDCEYNRDVAQYKEYDFQTWTRKRKFRPDIILHERLNSDFNMLAVESKPQNAKPAEENEDRQKVERVVTQTPYRYNLGAYLQFLNGPKVKAPGVVVVFYTEQDGWTPLQTVYGKFSDELAALAAQRQK